MLPVHALAAPMPLPIMASEVEDDLATMSVIAAELNDWIESGSFRTGLRSDSSIDLDGDGVPDTVFASSVDLLGEGCWLGGRDRAVDRGDGVVFRRLHATDTRLCRRAQCLLLRDRLHHGGRGVQACSIHCRVCRTSPAFGGSAGIL